MGITVAPSVVAAIPHAATPASFSLTSSDSRVTSSTKQALHVAIEASNNPSTPANDNVNVVLSKGVEDASETHIWTFPISSTVLHVAANGAGTLKMPVKDIAPFGTVSLTFKPLGKIVSTSCNGTVTGKHVSVSLSGVFFFDSKSTGAHKWGTVGNRKHFAFAATNTIRWSFSSASAESCVPVATTCTSSLFWSAQSNGGDFDGATTAAGSVVTGGSIFASRAVNLAKPAGAMRDDSNIGKTSQPTIDTAPDGNATLSVTGGGAGVSGSATITSIAPAVPVTTPCSGGKTQSSSFWSGTYANGSPGLTVAEQIYGSLKLTGSPSGSFGQSTVS